LGTGLGLGTGGAGVITGGAAGLAVATNQESAGQTGVVTGADDIAVSVRQSIGASPMAEILPKTES
jgi:hypothetical protein